MMSFRPFSDGDSHTVFQSQLDRVLAEIDALDNAYVLRCSITELENHFIDKASINPLILHADQRYVQDQQGP